MLTIRSVEFAIPWGVEEQGDSTRGDSSAEADCSECEPGSIGIADFVTQILWCLETLRHVSRLSITVLPFGGREHNGACARMRADLRRIQPRTPHLEQLTRLEISSAEFECCAMCTEVIVDIFQGYISQCDTVKLGATPNLFRRSAFTSLVTARTLYVRTDRTNRGRHGLFDALKLSTISTNVRKLILHSTQHFINLKCEAGVIKIDHIDRTWSFVSERHIFGADG